MITVDRYRLPMLVIGLVVLLALFWSTFISMATIWWRSETFAHGFFIAPISVWLIWRKRDQLAGIRARTDFRALVLLASIGLVWMLASLVDVLVVKQLAVVSAIPTMIWLLFGWNRTKAIAFPLTFLFFSVPMGEGLILPMMEFTAAFTVNMLKLSGVPVYWEGFLIMLPTGEWSIVEGCSGVRYLIASITVGTLYAYLTYRTLWRRAALVALAITVPIVGNGLRAYIIVMLGHLSDMRLAVGVDHIIYGWAFFGLLMLAMFWVGSLWRERDPGEGDGIPGTVSPPRDGTETRAKVATSLVAALLLLAVWPVWAARLERAAMASYSIDLSPPTEVANWVAGERFTDWAPRYIGATAELQRTYRSETAQAGLYLAYYATQRQGAEVVNSQNVMIQQKHPIWTQTYLRRVPVHVRDREISVYESELTSKHQRLLAWHWYWITGRHLADPYEAKLREAVVKLFGGSGGGAGIVVFTSRGSELSASRVLLQRFLDDVVPAVEGTLQDANAQIVSATSVSGEGGS